jgi:hypothetical protein
MNITLYQATIPTYLQIVGSVINLLDKAESHCANNNMPAEQLIQARLADDMLPFTFHITSVCHHSMGAINGLRKGTFSPDGTMLEDFESLRNMLTTTLASLEALSEDEINGFVGKPMRFEYGEKSGDYIAEEFLLSFSQPSFYFHAITTYDILRWKGVTVGKRDFLGKLRTK